MEAVFNAAFSGCYALKSLARRVTNRAYRRILSHMPGLTLGKNVALWGMPHIEIRNGGRIHIGDGTQLISTNHQTHVNYGVPTKLMAVMEGSEIVIGNNCSIGGACINAYGKISVGEYSLIGTNTNIFDANGHPIHLDQHRHRRTHLKDHEPITIGRDVWVALNCVVLPGTNIGDGTIISCNSVVRGEIPEYSIMAGNPAVVVGDVRKRI